MLLLQLNLPAASGSVTGTLASTLSNTTLSSSGTETFTGTLSSALNNTALAGSGTSINPVSGSLASTLGNTVLSASGTQTIQGALSAALADTTSSSSVASRKFSYNVETGAIDYALTDKIVYSIGMNEIRYLLSEDGSRFIKIS